jgi:hypothetical protein
MLVIAAKLRIDSYHLDLNLYIYLLTFKLALPTMDSKSSYVFATPNNLGYLLGSFLMLAS